MSRKKFPKLLVLLIALSALANQAVAQNTGPLQVKDLKPESLQRFGQADVLFVGKLVQVIPGPVGLSEPPLYSFKLNFVVGEVLRGDINTNQPLTGSFSIQQKNQPFFPEGKNCVVGVSQVKDSWRVLAVLEATDADIAQARLAGLVPLGWTMKEGKLLSPWAGLGAKAWPADAKGTGWICAATGRPALTGVKGVTFNAEPVPPKVELKFKNPDGDGEYKITVRNNTDKTVTVPALLTDGKNILWDDSLVILCQKKVYPIPGAKGVQEKPQPVELKPGEAVSTVVNVLKLQGPEWPMGGYRIEFQFCLGDKSNTQSLYYYSTHHDPLREKALGK